VIAIVALVAAAFAAIILTRGDSYEVTAEFENASQVVKGNQVVIGGAPVGSVSDIRLAADGQALITFTVEDEYAPLRRGTTAAVRVTSLSSVAGRQIQLTVPPDNAEAEEIPDGGRLDQSETITAVDVDQIFNTLDRKTVKDFKRVIQGFERAYEGVAPEANEGFRYMNPLFATSRQVFHALNSDQPALERLLVEGARFSGALAERSGDVSALIGNANLMMNAIGDRREQLAAGIRLFPGFMRNANTAFVNLRAALDDLDPLVIASRPAVRELGPFLEELRATARGSVPTIADLRVAIHRPGRDNDLIDLQKLNPKLAKRAIGSGFPRCGPGPEDADDLQVPADDDFTQGGFGESICSLSNGLNQLSYFRAYTPELVGWFDGFGHSGYADAFGGVGRVGLTLNTYSASLPGTFGLLTPFIGAATKQTPAGQISSLSTGNTRRCPGSAERPLSPSNSEGVPFTDGGALTDGFPGECDPSQVLPGE
jgi:phospholipid/cholesterol/gamma-HCH transport system substrate-binding protein